MYFSKGTPFKKAVIKKWNYLVGYPNDFELESRIFHSLILFTFAITFLNLVTYLILRLYGTVVAVSVNMIYYVILFYVSRFLYKTKLCIIVDAILLNIFLAFNYFGNDGINGPNLLLYSVSFVCLATYAPKKFAAGLLGANVLTVMALQITELNVPQWIKHNYLSETYRHADWFYVYISSAFLMYCGIIFLRRNYHFENRLAITEAEQLAVANAEKSKLFSIIAHDLRSPLAQINHYLQLLTQIELDKETRHSLEVELTNSTHHTQLLLTNLLTWSKNQLDGSRKISLAAVQLLPVARQVTNTLRSAALAKHITINTSIDDDVYVMADTDYLQIILRNILQNAVKFTPKNGAIHISCSSTLTEHTISIIDNGMGMTPEQQEKAFSLEAQSTYGTEMEKGVGLGLKLCQEFIMAQGGRIWFTSNAGAGTTFFMAFAKPKKLFKNV